MIHPVTVKDPSGKVKHVFDSEFLEERSKAICTDSGGHFSSHKVRSGVCERPECGKDFVTKQRGKKYCSKDCTNIMSRRLAKEAKAKRKEKQ